MPSHRHWKGLLFVGALLASVGCHHAQQHDFGHGGVSHEAMSEIAVPPAGTVPRELDKIVLPPYVIEAPDQLLIEVIIKGKLPEVDKDGKPVLENGKPKLSATAITSPLPVQTISGPFQVRLDGTVGLGFWGSVPVAGLTLEQTADTIRQHLARNEEIRNYGADTSLTVIVDVIAYNSKRYYVITDGGGAGEQVASFPITGSETVMDAIANIGGLSEVSSKRNIWVARRTPHPGQPWQILPVDWVGTSQHGISYTNYQIMPGDRVYVKAQRLVTIDRTLARIISPVERMFGITLLGTSTVNQIVGRGNGFGGNNGN